MFYYEFSSIFYNYHYKYDLLRLEFEVTYWIPFQSPQSLKENFQVVIKWIYRFNSFTPVIHKLEFLFTYFVNEKLGESFLTFLSSYSILEHCRTKWTKNEFLMALWMKYIILKKKKSTIMLLYEYIGFIAKY